MGEREEKGVVSWEEEEKEGVRKVEMRRDCEEWRDGEGSGAVGTRWDFGDHAGGGGCVCVCVRAKERQRGGGKRERKEEEGSNWVTQQSGFFWLLFHEAGQGEGGGEREGGREGGREGERRKKASE